MSIAFGQPVWIDDLLARIVAQLVARSGIPQDCVFESVASDQDHLMSPPADRFIVVFPASFPVDFPGVSGGGRLNTGFDGTVDVKVFSRVTSDQELRSARLFRDATQGLLPLVRKVLDSLQMFIPTTSAGAALVREPMRMTPAGFTIRPVNAQDKSTWAVVQSAWSVRFSSDIPAA